MTTQQQVSYNPFHSCSYVPSKNEARSTLHMPVFVSLGQFEPARILCQCSVYPLWCHAWTPVDIFHASLIFLEWNVIDTNYEITVSKWRIRLLLSSPEYSANQTWGSFNSEMSPMTCHLLMVLLKKVWRCDAALHDQNTQYTFAFLTRWMCWHIQVLLRSIRCLHHLW